MKSNALTNQVVNIPIKGINTSVAQESTNKDVGSYYLQNVDCEKLGVYKKRKGYKQISTKWTDNRGTYGKALLVGNETKNISKLAVRANKELVSISYDGFLNARSEAAYKNTTSTYPWNRNGKISNITTEKIATLSAYQSGQLADGCDLDYGNNFICIAVSRKNATGTAYYLEMVIFDTKTGAIMNQYVDRTTTYLFSCQPKVCYHELDKAFYIFSLDNAGTIIRHVFYINQPQLGFAVTSLTFGTVITAFDIQYCKSGILPNFSPAYDFLMVYRYAGDNARIAKLTGTTISAYSPGTQPVCADNCIPRISLQSDRTFGASGSIFAISLLTVTATSVVRVYQYWLNNNIIGSGAGGAAIPYLDLQTLGAATCNLALSSLSIKASQLNTSRNYVHCEWGRPEDQTTGNGIYTNYAEVYSDGTNSPPTLSVSPLQIPNTYLTHNSVDIKTSDVNNITANVVNLGKIDSAQTTACLIDVIGQDVSYSVNQNTPVPISIMSAGVASFGTKSGGKSRMPKICSSLKDINDSYSGQSGTLYTIVQEKPASCKNLSTNISLVKLTVNKDFHVTNQDNNLFIASGLPYIYDGNDVFESGFVQYPEILSITQNAGVASTGFPNGVRLQYKAVYEYKDASGKIHQSAASVAFPVTISALNNIPVITIRMLNVTAKIHEKIQVVLYRSDDDGATFQEVVDYNSGFYYHMYNSPTVVSKSVNDITGSSDGTGTYGKLASRQLYTQYSKDNLAFTSAKYCTVYNDRIWLAGCTDSPNDLYFSTEFEQGVSPTFSPIFGYPIPDNGVITGIDSVGGNLIVLKEKAIYSINGSGPNKLGGGSFFSPTNIVSKNIGCTYTNSVISTPNGLFFRSTRGMELLTNSLELQFIGEAIKDQIEGYDILDCTYSTELKKVYWILAKNTNDDITYDTKTLIFDFFTDDFYFHTTPKYQLVYPEKQYQVSSVAAFDSNIIYGGAASLTTIIDGIPYKQYLSKIFTYKTQSEVDIYDEFYLYRDSVDVYDVDNQIYVYTNINYQLIIETADITLNDINLYTQRLWNVGVDTSHCLSGIGAAHTGKLSIKIYHDFSYDYDQYKSWDFDGLVSSSDSRRGKLNNKSNPVKLHVKNQRAASHRVLIHDGSSIVSNPQNDIPGLAISSISFEVGIDQSKNKSNKKV